MVGAVVVGPESLLMDESLSSLDALLRVKIRSRIKKLQQKDRVTTIYVSRAR